MALVVHQEPQELTPAYNKQIFVALSDEIAQTDFKYIVEVTVNGDTAHTYTEDILQRPDGHIVFDAKNWVQNYIEHYFNPELALTYPIAIATNKSVSVEVKIKEYYTAAVQSTITINYVAFDACLNDEEFRTYDFNDYIFDGTASLYYLSKTTDSIFPDTRVVLNQDVWLHFINKPSDLISDIVIDLRRANATIDTVSIASLPTPVTAYDVLALRINSSMFVTATTQSGDVIRITYNSGVTQVLRHSLSITEISTDFTPYTVYYLDRNGNTSFFHFEKLSTINHTKKISEVKLGKDTLNTTTHLYGSNTWDRENHIINTTIESTITLNTDWITQEQSEQLIDLFASPILYLWDGVKLRATKMNGTAYEQKVEGLDPLFNYTITVDLGVTETRQRGI